MKFLLFLSFCIVGAFSQTIDDTFCNTDTITPDDGENIPIPSQNLTQRYQVVIEKNKLSNRIGYEVQEYFDGVANLGISITTVAGEQIYTYSYYDRDELLLVEKNQCKVYKISESYDISPFYVLTLPNGTEHIVTELGLILNNPSNKVAYLGSKNRFVRSIPAREWLYCYYSKKDDATFKVTISYSNSKLWAPAVIIPGYESVPLQVKIDSKTRSGVYATEYNVLTQFRPGLLLQEEDYFTRSGVYCEGRAKQNITKLPDLPKAFSYISQSAESDIDMDSLSGTLRVSRVDLDYEKKLYRFDYRQNSIRFTEIHDENTGLKYKIDDYHDNCSISLLAEDNIESHSPIEFFKLDENPPFEYVGQRRVRGINTDVWIAPRKTRTYNSTWEWHFMTTGWIAQEFNSIKTSEPVLLKINVQYDLGANIKSRPVYFHVSNFDQTRINLFDFDLARCDKITKQHMRFNITSDKYELMKKNRGAVAEGLMISIQSTTKVNFIRISQLELIFDNGTLVVLFTLLDRSTLGNKDPISLTDAIESLTTAITSSKFEVIFNDINNEKYSVKADKDSLVNLDVREGKYIYKYYSGKSTGYSSGSVAGFAIGFTIIGLVLGLVGGVFLILRRQSSISLPGPLSFFNPNFKAEA